MAIRRLIGKQASLDDVAFMPDKVSRPDASRKRTGCAMPGQLIAGVDHVLYRKVRNLLPDSERVVLAPTDLARVDSLAAAHLFGCTYPLALPFAHWSLSV